MPAASFLPVAGPVGTIVSLGAGTLVMLVVALNFGYMAYAYSGEGGPLVYAR